MERNSGKGSSSYIEMFGLTKSGKTTLYKKLIQKGHKGLEFDKLSRLSKIFNFTKFMVKHPIKFSYLFFKMNTNRIRLSSLKAGERFAIFSTRNSYLSAVFSKYEYSKKKRGTFFVDEFLLQSLFVIKQEKASEKEIRSILSVIPQSSRILLVEEDSKERWKRHKRVKKRARNLNKEYRDIWVKNSNFNYNIIRKVLFEEYLVSRNPRL